MITDHTDVDAPSCCCSPTDDLDVLRCLVAAGHDQRQVSHLLWGDARRASLEVQLAYAAHQANETAGRVRRALQAAFPWLRLPVGDRSAA